MSLVGDVGDLLEHDLLDRRLGQLLERVVRARVVAGCSPALSFSRRSGCDEGDHALFVGVAEHDHASVVEQVEDRRDLAARDEGRRLDDVERLVQHDQLTFHELEWVDVRVQVHAHRPAVDEDLAGSVFVGALEDAVRVRRRAQLVDFLLEELDLLLRFLQRADEPLVLALGVGDCSRVRW